MARNSLTDIAFVILNENEKEMSFNDLWSDVSAQMGYTEVMAKRKIASFYNALMLDSRFISLEKNHWDLRDRYAEDTLQIDPDLVIDYDDYDEYDDSSDYLDLENDD